MNKKVQAKHITDEQILYVIDLCEVNEGRWTLIWDLEYYYPMIPRKVLLAKCKSMIRRGLLDGCPCGCRGDFERPDRWERQQDREKAKKYLGENYTIEKIVDGVMLLRTWSEFKLIPVKEDKTNE